MEESGADALSACAAAERSSQLAAMTRFDLRVYAVLDPARCHGRPLADMASAAARGGATLLQLRDKAGTTATLLEEARAVGAALATFGVPLLVNDRVDVALAAQSAGVHLGADDMPVEDARRLLGPDAIIGRTVRSIAEAESFPAALADYASIGGVFATASKRNPEPPIGLDGLKELARRLAAQAPDLPFCAIAGIGHSNAAEVVGAGAAGVAVIADIFMADDVEAATRRLRGIVDASLAQRRRQ
jgi:thiamine-phosphate pyrophosphorylase